MFEKEILSDRGFGLTFAMCLFLRSKGSCRHTSLIFTNLSYSRGYMGYLCNLNLEKVLPWSEFLGGLGGLPTPPFAERLSFPPFRSQKSARHLSLPSSSPARKNVATLTPPCSSNRQGLYETPWIIWKILRWIRQIVLARFVAAFGRVERVSPDHDLSVHFSRTTNHP